MAHISVDLPGISPAQKKKLIEDMREVLSEITGIDKSEISVSLHELPQENMNGSENPGITPKAEKIKENTQEKEIKKKSFFKEMFP